MKYWSLLPSLVCPSVHPSFLPSFHPSILPSIHIHPSMHLSILHWLRSPSFGQAVELYAEAISTLTRRAIVDRTAPCSCLEGDVAQSCNPTICMCERFVLAFGECTCVFSGAWYEYKRCLPGTCTVAHVRQRSLNRVGSLFCMPTW